MSHQMWPRGEGVENPENFADVLYVWSQRTLLGMGCSFAITKLINRTSKKRGESIIMHHPGASVHCEPGEGLQLADY